MLKSFSVRWNKLNYNEKYVLRAIDDYPDSYTFADNGEIVIFQYKCYPEKFLTYVLGKTELNILMSNSSFPTYHQRYFFK